MTEFTANIQEIKRRARHHIQNGAVTEGYKADKATVLKLLNDSLATELICVMRYKRHYQTASGLASESIAEEFLEHAKEEQEHADLLADRITQLGGEPNFDPATLTKRSHTEYVECSSLIEMIEENLIAERIAIDIYGEIIRYIGDKDPTTRRLVETILEKEEEHAEDMSTLLNRSGVHQEKGTKAFSVV